MAERLIKITYGGLHNVVIDEILNEFIQTFNIQLEKQFDNTITHVILPSNYKSYDYCMSIGYPKYVNGIIHKKYVISFDWVIDSKRSKILLNEEPYECIDNCFNKYISKKSRLSNDLFEHFLFTFNDNNIVIYEENINNLSIFKFSQQDLTNLITSNGGIVTNDAYAFGDNNKIHINLFAKENGITENKENTPNCKTLNLHWKWILHSLKEYKLRPINFYLIGKIENVPENLKYLISDNINESLRELKNFLPNLDEDFITRCFRFNLQTVFCNHAVPHKNRWLNSLTNYLIENGGNHLKKVEEKKVQPNANEIHENYEHLIGIFPNIDPTYLLKQIENKKPEVEINDLINNLLETKYPTRDEYVKKMNINEQQKKFGENFNIDEFLKSIPNPIEYFEDPNRKNKWDLFGFDFLKAHFNKHKVLTIKKVYKDNNFNLSLSANALRTLDTDMKTKRYAYQYPCDNIPILQEVAYIKYHDEIKKKLDEKKNLEDELFKLMEEQNLLVNCECCFNEKCIPEKCIECNKGHNFCQDCLIAGVETALADGKYRINCFSQCESELPLSTLQKLLPAEKFSQFLKNNQLQEIEAAGITGLETCPFCSEFVTIPPVEDKIFRCLNSNCMKESCRSCKKANHIPFKCNEKEVKEENLRKLIEEKMTEALIRNCVKCKKPFVKETGCNKMICPACGAKMCYICNKEIKGYDHFNAQGGARTDLCPLWTDDKYLEAEGVRMIGHNLKNLVLKQNPELNVNVETLLPNMPKKIGGAHTYVPNAYEQPAHIKKMIQEINENKE